MRKSRELGDRMFFNKDLVELSELFCLCCMAALKSLPALSFNALIIPILRIVCTYYINTLKREIVDTNAYKPQPSLSERVIVDGHGCHTALHLVSKLKNIKTKFLRCTGYLNSIKKPFKARFIANSSSCTTTELSKLLTSCLTTVKKHVIKYCEKVYERSGKNLFWSIKNSGENLDDLKAREFNATLYVMTEMHFLLRKTLKNIMHGLVKMFVMH